MNRGQAWNNADVKTGMERRWVWIFAGVVMFATSLPYLIGFSQQGESWRFTGFVFGVEDGNSYIAKMLSGAQGAWLFRTPYTTQPQGGVVAFLPYLLIGKLSAGPGQHEQLVTLYHLFRIFCGFLAIHATYDFIAYFVDEIRLRKTGLAIATLGGGLGWVLILLGEENWLGELPLEFYSPETFGFLALFGIAHLNLARAALLWGLTAYLKSVEKTESLDLKNVFKIGGFWLLAAIAQPLTALVLGIVIGLHLCAVSLDQIWTWRKNSHFDAKRINLVGRYAFLAGLIPAPFMIYNFLAFNQDPYLISWTAQNIIKSPHPLHYVSAYGAMAPFAFLGGRRLLTHSRFSGLLPVAWVLALPLLAYAPFNLQRRMPEGIWVAIVVLALYSFQSVAGLNKISLIRWFMLAGIFFISTILLLVGSLIAVMNLSSPVFRPASEIMAFKYLVKNARVNDAVLAAYTTSNPLPAWAPVRVVVGHGPESVGGLELTTKVNAFYGSGMSDELRVAFLEEHGVDYVLWGPAERDLGEWNPGAANFLENVFDYNEYSVFAVSNENN